MFMREAPTLTLPDVREDLERTEGGEVLSALSSEIELRLTADEPTVVVKGRELPASERGVSAIAQRLHVPTNFIGDLDADLQQYLLQRLLERNPTTHAVKVHDDEGVLGIWAQSANQVDPRRIVDIAARVMTPEAPVLDFDNDPGQHFVLDVLTPHDFDRGWGGDRQVNDLTGAALRFTQNRRTSEQFHAPEVALLLYRLACTNGYEDVDEAAKVDARGSTLEEVMREMEELAERLFSRAEERIGAFYEMRQNRVDHPEQRIMREAAERGIPDRIAAEMVREVPAYVGDGEDAFFTEFDLVNLITNQANNPRLRRAGPRRNLQRAGGTLIGEHVARCAHCQAKLN